MHRTAATILVTTALASCVAPPVAPPAPPPPVAQPAAPPPPPPPRSADWREWPVTPGNWTYKAATGGSIASFGQEPGTALLSLRCDLATRRVFVSRAVPAPSATPGGPMVVRTSFGTASWPTETAAQGQGPAMIIAARASSDTVLDQMIFSRGRFAVEVSGAQPLVVPAWAEAARVIEDCRS
ncbi:hypothetical protein [Sphingobium subterraneum]|uniref:hypothetical protein n=1 Tax=Sphingobium subterraneum TaxID=627688 RepID=UPI001FE2979D|nr:hypothetical protein [Sphingobium subterraneum]